MTTDMVAARAGVSKATMYRRWPSKAVLVIDAVESLRSEPLAEPSDTGSLVGDLASLLDSSGSSPGSRKFSDMAGLISALPRNPELASAVRRQIMQPRIAAIRIAVERERDRGAIPRHRNLDTLSFVVAATITCRLIVMQEPADRAFLDALVSELVTT